MAGVARRSWPRLVALQLIVVVATLVSLPTFVRVLEPLLGVPPGTAAQGFVPGLPIRSPVSPSPALWLSFLVTGALSGLLYILTVVAGIRVAVLDAAGRTEALTTSLRFGLSRMFPLVGWMIVCTVAAGVALVVGVLAAAVALLYVGVVLVAALVGVVVVERGNITRCFTLVNRAFLPTTGRMAIFAVVGAGYSVATQLAVDWAFGPALTGTAVVVQAVLQMPVILFTCGVSVVTYAELRHRENPEVTTQTLADELDRPCPPLGRRIAAALLVVLGLLAVVVPDRVAAETATVSAAKPKVAGPPIPVRNDPRSITLSPDSRFGYLVHAGAKGQPGVVSVVDLVTRAEVAAIPVGVDPWRVAVLPDGRSAYVSNYGEAGQGSGVSVIDTGTGTVTGTILAGVQAFGMAITSDGGKLYVTDYGSGSRPGRQVWVVDTGTMNVVRSIPVGEFPRSVTISRDGRRAYVTAYGTDAAPGNTMTVFDTATDSVVSTITMDPRPTSVVVTPDGARLFVTLTGSDSAPGSGVAVVDAATGKTTATIPAGVEPLDAQASPDGRYLYVVNYGVKSAYGNTVTVIDTEAERPVATLVVGTTPTGVAITPDGRWAYVANSRNDTLTVIDTGIR